MDKRIKQLDSLRGIAAFSVFLHHISIVTTIPIFTFLCSHISPLSIFFNGYPAVILFFILSGFVLSLPFLEQKKISYHAFLTKRFFRIYIPYLISIVFAIIMCLFVSRKGIKDLSEWFNNSWTGQINLEIILNHIFMIGYFNFNEFNNVIWSLIHEMRISIIFPLIALILLNLDWKGVFAICISLSLLSGLNNVLNIEVIQGNSISIFKTLHYISMFMVGGLIAKYRESLLILYWKLPRNLKYILVLLAYICYNYSGVMRIIADKFKIASYGEILGDYSIAFGVTIIILISLGSRKVTKLLLTKPFRFLGKISYSLYLYHLTVLYSLVYILYNHLPFSVIFLLTFIATLLLSSISYYFIELPSIKIGKRISYFRFKVEKDNPIKMEKIS